MPPLFLLFFHILKFKIFPVPPYFSIHSEHFHIFTSPTSDSASSYLFISLFFEKFEKRKGRVLVDKIKIQKEKTS